MNLEKVVSQNVNQIMIIGELEFKKHILTENVKHSVISKGACQENELCTTRAFTKYNLVFKTEKLTFEFYFQVLIQPCLPLTVHLWL